MLNASSGGLDLLEQTAKILGKTEWELFQEICEVSQVNNGRRDMLWDGYATEDFLPTFVNEACYKICMSFHGESS